MIQLQIIRCLSAANDIITKGNTRMNNKDVQSLVLLRMNKPIIELFLRMNQNNVMHMQDVAAKGGFKEERNVKTEDLPTEPLEPEEPLGFD